MSDRASPPIGRSLPAPADSPLGRPRIGSATITALMARTVIVEPHPIGHRFEHVSWIARVALARGDDVELLTSVGARSRAEFTTFLGDLPLTVHEAVDGYFPRPKDVGRALLELHRRSPITTAVLLDADQALKRWWLEAPLGLRGRRGPTTILLLMRFPQDLALRDRTAVAMWAAKVSLSALTRAGRAADRIIYLVGRHESRSGRLLGQVRDPAICSAHARDRAALRERYDLPADRRLVGIIGDLSDRKCLPMVAEAVRLAGPDVDLLLAGKMTDDMRAWLEALAPADRARVHTRLGFLPDEELDAYVAASDVISLALLNPGPSGIQGKALVAGVPTVSAGSRLRERESTTYDAGVHVDLDAASLAGGIRRMLDRGGEPLATPDDVPTAAEFGEVMLGGRRPSRREATR
jgi:glycosyltransferase involved in cell wall biosynthesis